MTDLPARSIPIPTSVSGAAQQVIAMGPLLTAIDNPE